jgi:hypothetical protein
MTTEVVKACFFIPFTECNNCWNTTSY